VSKNWQQIASISVTAQDMQTNPEVFNNLQGDKFDYMIYFVVQGATANDLLEFNFNNDTGANYREYRMRGLGTTAQATVAEIRTYITAGYQGDTGGVYSSLGKMVITGNSSSEKKVDIFFSGDYASTHYIQKDSFYWKNTSDELNEINITALNGEAITADFYLFARPKQGVFNAEDWEIVEKYDFSAVNLNSAPKTFNNLLGDSDEQYLLDIDSDNDLLVQFNADSGTNYTEQTLDNNAGTLEASTSAVATGITIAERSINLIDSINGKYRSVLSSNDKTSANQQTESINWWRNNSDELTSIKISDIVSQTSTGTITLYKSSKFKASTDAHEIPIEEYEIGVPEWTANNSTLDPIDANIKDYWKLEDLTDSVGGKTFTNNGSATFTSGKHNNALTLNGSSQYLNRTYDDALGWDGRDYTLSMWCYIDTHKDKGDTTKAPLQFGKMNPTTDTNSWSFGSDSDGKMSFFYYDGSIHTHVGATTISTGTWVHLAMVHDVSANTVYLYLNGSLDGSGSTAALAAQSADLIIGANNSVYFDGQIDEIGLWHYAMNSDEIEALYNSTVGAFRDGESDFSGGYTFKNLRGDSDGLYKIYCSELKSSADFELRMQKNGDTGSNYEQQLLRATSTTPSANSNTTTYFPVGMVSSDYPGLSEMFIYPKSGKYRPCILTGGGESGGAYYKDLYSFWWKNTADVINEIKVYASASTAMTGKIQLFKIPLLNM
jgi:hypothetical protein